jgi:peptide/nickel transport system substrate-binding protein
MNGKRWTWLTICALVLVACQPQTVVVEKKVTVEVIQEVTRNVTQIVEKEVEVTRVVKETVGIEVTPTPTSIPRGGTLKLIDEGVDYCHSPFEAGSGCDFLLLSLLWVDPFEPDPWTGETLPGLVERWEIADDNKKATFYVRQGVNWSDGEPITAHDFKFMFDALMATDEEGNSATGSGMVIAVEQVETVELVDDYTLAVTYKESGCANFDRLHLAWWPSHVFLSDPDFEFSDLPDHPFNQVPTVFSGPFMLDEWVEGEQITLVRNPDYWKGSPNLEGVQITVRHDPVQYQEVLKAGEADVTEIDVELMSQIEQVPFLDLYRLPQDVYEFIALQIGDPEDPQPRLNADGTVNEAHGAHPILSSKAVRQALVYALDRWTIVNKIWYGQAVLMHSAVPPIHEWAYHDGLEARAYDPERAAEMLEEAGWVLEGGAEVRVCRGCGTAPDGTPMILSVKTNWSNPRRMSIMELVQEQWGQVGVGVETLGMEWDAYLDALLGQAFDTAIISLLGEGMHQDFFFLARYDVPGQAFNMSSFYRPDYEELVTRAMDVPGCSYEDRAALYRQTQEMLYDEQPYIWLYSPRRLLAVHRRIGGIDPGPWSTWHNVHEWYIKGE